MIMLTRVYHLIKVFGYVPNFRYMVQDTFDLVTFFTYLYVFSYNKTETKGIRDSMN